METSAVDASEVPFKEDLTCLDSIAEQIGDGNTEKSDKSKHGTDPEGHFLDAEAVANLAVNANSLDSGGPGIPAENEDDGGSIESFDSALERIATVSTGDPSSPVGPSSPFFEPTDTIQQNALQKLNLWNSGVPSLDSMLLDNVTPTEFRAHVAQLAEAQGLSTDSDDVENILSALLPLVEGTQKEDIGSMDAEDGDNGNNVDGAEANKQDNSVQVESHGEDFTKNQPVALDPLPSEAQESDDASNVVNNKISPPDNWDVSFSTSDHEEVIEAPEKDSTKMDLVAEIGDGEASKSIEQEPEIIEWDNMNESDVDDINTNAQIVDAKQGKEAPIMDSSKVVEAPVSNVNNESQAPSESEFRQFEGDSSTERVVVDNAEEAVAQNSEVESVFENQALVKSETADETVSENAEAPIVSNEVIDGAALEHEASTDSKETSDETIMEAAADLKEVSDGTGLKHTDALVDLKEVGSNSAYKERESRELEQSVPGGEYGVEKEVLAGDENLEGKLENDLEANATRKLALSEVDVEVKGREIAGHEGNSELSFGGDSEQTNTESNDSTNSEHGTQNASLQNAQGADLLEHALPSESKEPSQGDADNQEKPGTAKEESVIDSPALVAAAMDSKTSTASGNEASSLNGAGPSLGGAGPSLPARPPAGLGRSVPSLEHAPRAVQRSSGVSASARQTSVTNEENRSSNDVSEGSEDAREKLQMIRVKFLRLAQRLGQSAHNVVVAQVLYRLGLAEQLRGGRGTGRTGAFSFERASVLAEEQEAAGSDDLEFGCTIMVLGKSGVGKSATINSLFDEVKSGTNAYNPATSKVQEIVGTVHGIKLRVIDTPGLLTSFSDQRRNERIMASVKRFIKKSPPDIVLYFDRLDMQSRDYGDLPLLRTITDTFGSAVWFNAIVVLTHASSAPPDGANGVPVSYEMFVAQRSHVVQQTIRQAAGDMRLMNPVSLVENHAACRRNRAGERVLPNGQVWKPQLLLLCFASKILAEANSLLKLQDNTPAKPFGVRSRVPPLPFLLSSLLQSRAQLKLPDEQIGSEDESEDDSEDDSDSDGEEYDDLPPFRRLTKDEMKLLDKDQRKIYTEELELREKLFMKKQLKDEHARKKELKRRLAALPKEVAQFAEESLEEENASAAVPVPMPDMALPPSFDSDNPTHRYRYLETANQWLVRPVLETHGWDHDSGYDGLNVEKLFVISKKIPVSVSGQVTKDKKEANLQMECAASFKNGEGKVTQTGLDIQTIGKDLAYTLRSETRFNNFKRNKTTCGLAVTLLGDTVAAGMKIEDRLIVGKRVKLVFNGGALTGRGDVAYGGSLEVTVRDKDYPLGQFLSTFGLSVMDWHGDLAIGGNLQVQCKVGKTTMVARGNLNNRRAGQVSIRVSSSEQLQIALIGLIPLLRTFINNRILSSN